MATFPTDITMRQLAMLMYFFAVDDFELPLATLETRFQGAGVVDDLNELIGYGYAFQNGSNYGVSLAGITDILDLFGQSESDAFNMPLSVSAECFGADNLPAPLDQMLVDIHAIYDTAPTINPCVTQAVVDCAKAKATEALINLAQLMALRTASANNTFNTNFFRRTRDMVDNTITDGTFLCMTANQRDSQLTNPIDSIFNFYINNSPAYDESIYDNIC